MSKKSSEVKVRPGVKAGPRIPKPLVEALQKGQLSRDMRQEVADRFHVHINQIGKITAGEAPYNLTNRRIIAYMTTLITGKLYSERDRINSQLKYLTSEKFKEDLKIY